MKAGLEYFFDGAELRFRQEASAKFLRAIGETAQGSAGDGAQRTVQRSDTKMHGAREIFRKNQELGGQAWADFGSMKAFVRIPRAARTQTGRPFESIGLADERGFARGLGRFMAHIEHAGGLIGAFEVLADLHELPAFIMND